MYIIYITTKWSNKMTEVKEKKEIKLHFLFYPRDRNFFNCTKDNKIFYESVETTLLKQN